MKKCFLLAFYLLFFGCTVQKDRRAVSRIEANRTLLDQVFVEGLKLHPCSNDTTHLKPIIDHIGTTTTDTIKPKQKPIQPNEKPCIPDTIKIKTTKTFHDSIPYLILDRQQIEIRNDTILQLKKDKSFQAGQLSAKDVQIKAQQKKEIWLYGIISGLMVFIVIYFGVKIYLSVSKVIPVI